MSVFFSTETTLNGLLTQGTFMGLEAFIAMIDDLKRVLIISNTSTMAQYVKYKAVILCKIDLGKRHENKC